MYTNTRKFNYSFRLCDLIVSLLALVSIFFIANNIEYKSAKGNLVVKLAERTLNNKYTKDKSHIKIERFTFSQNNNNE